MLIGKFIYERFKGHKLRKSLCVKNFALGEDGAAAIEFVFIFPFMIVLYFGLVDVTGLISVNRRVVSGAATMADLVGQQKTKILKTTINDQFNAVYTIMQPLPSSSVRIEVFNFRKVSGVITKIWQTSNNLGPSCGTTDPDTTNMSNLMTAGNDVIVARTCVTFIPIAATYGLIKILGSTSINLKQTISVRPRSSLTLACETVPTGTTICS